jgi:toxin ParE1/3/4
VKASRVQLSELAISDILELADWYESQSDVQLAQRWQEAVTSTLLRVSKLPNSGSPCRFRATELRGTRRLPIAGFPRHLMFYQFTKGEVFVLRIVHGARDLERLFGE